ncbi:molybdenum cofactor biosynthesis protein B [Neptuniibacter sp. QD48_55]|uniref:molybdenum cofactor biosynthesis protein B n=1 Tax=Neptuniibacter sp. QD48_55 TaxID=3398212 RepID=UPI0039F4F72F
MSHTPARAEFIPLNIAVLTVSDTRTLDSDTSGQALVDRLEAAGHVLGAREIVKDDIYQMRAVASRWIADSNIHVIISTGGTGFSGRDSTPEAMAPLFDKSIEGFGEFFRQVSAGQIGTSTIQSRALGGLANGTVIFCLPGSTGACRTGWDDVIAQQLDHRHKPCNFASLIMKHQEDNA